MWRLGAGGGHFKNCVIVTRGSFTNRLKWAKWERALLFMDPGGDVWSDVERRSSGHLPALTVLLPACPRRENIHLPPPA